MSERAWIWTLCLAAFSVAFAAAGLALTTAYPGAAPLLATAFLLASIASTAATFGLLATRVRRLELENEGLVEELSQELARLKDRLDVQAPQAEAPQRRIIVK